jgi:hypothetical protein
MSHSAEILLQRICNFYVDPALCSIALNHDPAPCRIAGDQDPELSCIARDQNRIALHQNRIALDQSAKIWSHAVPLKETIFQNISDYPYTSPSK